MRDCPQASALVGGSTGVEEGDVNVCELNVCELNVCEVQSWDSESDSASERKSLSLSPEIAGVYNAKINLHTITKEKYSPDVSLKNGHEWQLPLAEPIAKF